MGVMRKLVEIVAKKKAKHIEELLENQVVMSEDILMDVVKKHQDTIFGKRHRFSDIRKPEQFREHVPLYDHYSMAKYYEALRKDPTAKILTTDPVVWYLSTSGTTGKPKYIPVTKTGIKMVSKGTMLSWMGFMHAGDDHSKIIDGTLITFGAGAEIDHVGEIPVGYATGVYAQFQNPLFQRLMKPGPEIFDIMDIDDKLWEYAKLMIRENVTGLQGITTLSLTIIRRMQDLYGIRLLDEFKGTKYESRIRDALDNDGRMDVTSLWPDLKLFLATGIDTDPYREWITKTLPEVMIWEMYGGSEGYYAGQLQPNDGMALSSHINYFEFIPEKDCEDKNPITLTLDEVKAGQRYEVVITNIGGRYRYRLGDMLTMKSTYPFVVTNIGRNGRVVNLSGEKLSEAHISHAIDYACRKTGAELQDYTVVGEVIQDSGLPYYTIAAMFRNTSNVDLHEFIGAFEQNIMENNNEFRVVRETGALGPTQLALMKNSIFEQRVKATHIQTKPLPLSTDTSILKLCEVVT